MLSAPVGSTPKTWHEGRASLTAAATPGAQAAAADRDDDRVEVRHLLAELQASVAVPSAVSGPSNGCTNVRPSSFSISRTRSKARCTSSTSSTSAPSSRQRATR